MARLLLAATTIALLTLSGCSGARMTSGSRSSLVNTLPVNIREVSNYTLLATSNSSELYQMEYSADGLKYPYVDAPYLLKLKADSRQQVGYDYANLLAEQTEDVLTSFIGSVLGKDQKKWSALFDFVDFLWKNFYTPDIPQRFLAELEGMDMWSAENPDRSSKLQFQPSVVSRRFFALANMPADPQNIITGLEQELEKGWPSWLKDDINNLINKLDHCEWCKFSHHCDAYGVWGSRTQNGRLYTSRNLDYNPDTGINKYKIIISYDILDSGATERKKYASIGFAFGPGALAGMSAKGITTSEMNLDNAKTTYSGLPFPLRLRYVMEEAHDLKSAMTVWNATNNTNSFNFMIGSAADGQAYALETMRGYTGEFPDNSPIEATSTYDCGMPPNVQPSCKGWTPNMMTNKTTGKVPIGFPLPEAVWRSNHGMNPEIMKTQEPLFNDTIFRYNLMHELFSEFESKGGAGAIGDDEAVGIVATLGIKGPDFFTCDESFQRGSNVMSIAYVPGEQRLFAAWELGQGAAAWRPAACAPYLHLNMSMWWN